MDIGDVDLILCYDAHKSPVRLVQRMGRTGRKRDGRIVMLMTEGKEEHVYKTSMYQKKNMLKNVVGSDKLRNHLAASPRMVPNHIVPRCHEMPMTVAQKFPVGNPRAKAAGSSAAASSTSRKNKTTKSYYLTEQESDYWKEHFQMDLPAAVLAEPNATHVADRRRCLELDQWLPWQCSLQPTHSVGHSTLTSEYVQMTQFISSQLDPVVVDDYDALMKHSLQMDDVDRVSQFDDQRPACSPVTDNLSYVGMDEIEADREVSTLCSQMADEPTRPTAWESTNRGIFSPTFLHLFSNDERTVPNRELLNFVSPPPMNFQLTPDSPVSSQDSTVYSRPGKCSWPPPAVHTPSTVFSHFDLDLDDFGDSQFPTSSQSAHYPVGLKSSPPFDDDCRRSAEKRVNNAASFEVKLKEEKETERVALPAGLTPTAAISNFDLDLDDLDDADIPGTQAASFQMKLDSIPSVGGCRASPEGIASLFSDCQKVKNEVERVASPVVIPPSEAIGNFDLDLDDFDDADFPCTQPVNFQMKVDSVSSEKILKEEDEKRNRIASTIVAAPLAAAGNFELDLNFSNVSESDLIPETPPRPSQNKSRAPLKPTSPQSRTLANDASNQLEEQWSPVLSQRRRKSLKRKLSEEIEDSSDKRVRFGGDDVLVANSGSNGQTSHLGNGDLFTVTQAIEFINKSPVRVQSAKKEASSVVPNHRIEANFDLEVDFLERSPLSVKRLALTRRPLSLSSSAGNPLNSTIATAPFLPTALTKTSGPVHSASDTSAAAAAAVAADALVQINGTDHASVWDDAFDLSLDDMIEIDDAVAYAFGTPTKPDSLPMKCESFKNATAIKYVHFFFRLINESLMYLVLVYLRVWVS